MLKGSYRERKEREKRKRYNRRRIRRIFIIIIFWIVSLFPIFFILSLNIKKSEYEIMDEALKSYEQEKLLRDKGEK